MSSFRKPGSIHTCSCHHFNVIPRVTGMQGCKVIEFGWCNGAVVLRDCFVARAHPLVFECAFGSIQKHFPRHFDSAQCRQRCNLRLCP